MGALARAYDEHVDGRAVFAGSIGGTRLTSPEAAVSTYSARNVTRGSTRDALRAGT